MWLAARTPPSFHSPATGAGATEEGGGEREECAGVEEEGGGEREECAGVEEEGGGEPEEGAGVGEEGGGEPEEGVGVGDEGGGEPGGGGGALGAVTRVSRRSPGFSIVKTRRGARLVQDDAVLSEILARPGPGHGVFDVLAACLALSAGPRCLVLGFAGGGVMAPLRAMGWPHPIEAVDLSLEGEAVFRRLAGEWAGEVTVRRADAVAWLRRSRRRFDLVLEDLSVPSAAGVVKPDAALDELPDLVGKRLRPGGLAVTNLLAMPGVSWGELLTRVARPFRDGVVVTIEEYENRILLAGRQMESAARVSRRLRDSLTRIGSRQASRIAVRTLGVRQS